MNIRLLPFVSVLALFISALPSTGQAETHAQIHGSVIDTVSERPLADVQVRVDTEDAQYLTTTASDGYFSLEVPDAPRYDVELTVEGQVTTWRQQPTGAWLDLELLVTVPSGSMRSGALQGKLGFPDSRADVLREPAFLLREPLFSRQFSPTSIAAPETIRVAMHVDDDCREPIEEIVEVSLEEYVQGVVYSEIGVFRSLEGGPESASAVLRVFAVAARSYVVWFYQRDPDAAYHINNTACNQRFEQVTSPSITAAVADTAGIIMTQIGDSGRLDKLEYAASCGRTDTLPEYGTIDEDLIPDNIPESDRACVGSWCGHDSCAAHQTHPDYPDRGRCLVRGICQWGSAERSVRGESWQDILAHYQPNLQLTDLNAPMTASVVGFVREGNIADGANIDGATVRIGDVEVFTGSGGYFEFLAIPIGEVELTVTADGYESATRIKVVEAGVTNWASIALDPVIVDPDPDTVEDAVDGSDTDDAEVEDAAGTADLSDSAEPDSGADTAAADGADTSLTSDTAGYEPGGILRGSGGGCRVAGSSGGLGGPVSTMLSLLAFVWFRRSRRR